LQSNSISLKALLHSIILICLLQASCTQYKPDLQLAEQLMERAPDSALHILQRIPANKISGKADHALYALLMSQALDKNDIKTESDSLTSIATEYYNADEPERAGYAWFYQARTAQNRDKVKEQANDLLKAQEFSEKTTNNKLQGLVYGDKGMMYSAQKQYDSSICYFKRTYQSLDKIHDYYNCLLSLIYIGGDFRQLSKYDSALVYFHQAESLSNHVKAPLVISSLYRNLGSGYLKKGDYKRALQYFKKVPWTGVALYDNNKWLLIANVFIKLNEGDSTRYYLNKVNPSKELAPNYYEVWMKLNEKNGNLENALSYAKKINIATDTLYETKLKISFAGLEKKFKYQSLQIANQNLIISNKQKGIYLLWALLLLITSTLLIVLWRLRVKKQLLRQEKALVESEKLKFEKERENNLLLEKQVKFQNILMLNIEQHRKNSIKRPNSGSENSDQSKSNFYDELIACMDLEYNDISHRLKQRFPNLTQQDILICCFLLARFDTGMIASVMDVKNDSMLTRRSRLRAKLKLSTFEDFNDFLRRF